MLVCVFVCYLAHETAGAARTRSSLRPLIQRAGILTANLAQNMRRERELMCCRAMRCLKFESAAPMERSAIRERSWHWPPGSRFAPPGATPLDGFLAAHPSRRGLSAAPQDKVVASGQSANPHGEEAQRAVSTQEASGGSANASPLRSSSDTPDAPRSCSRRDARPVRETQYRWRGRRRPAPVSASP